MYSRNSGDSSDDDDGPTTRKGPDAAAKSLAASSTGDGLLAGGLLAELRSWARYLMPASRYKAVYYPTSMPVALAMLRLAGVGPDDVVGS
jgi:hypothetical protein